MKKQKSKVFEFLTLVSMIIGIVIGTGEFIKNDSETPGHILNATGGNAIMAIIIWIIIGLSCILMIFAFIEVASSTAKNGNGTLSNWLKIFVNRRVASYVSLFWTFMYIPIIYALFSLMGIAFILQSFNINFTHLSAGSTTTYILGSLTIFLFFVLTNALTRKPGKIFQIVGTILKFIPFILILVIAFIPSLDHTSKANSFHSANNSVWSASAFFMATGPVLFSFDGFILVTNLQKETKNKNLLYTALIVGMLLIVFIYILEAIALFVGTYDGSVATLFMNAFNSEKIDTILDLMIVFAIFVGLNGISVAGSRNIKTDTDAGLLCNFNRKISNKLSGLIQAGIGLAWWALLIGLGLFINKGMIPGSKGSEFNPGEYADLLSNIVVEFAFLIYLVIAFAAIINRKTKKVDVRKVKYMPILASIGSMILLIFTISAIVITLMDSSSIYAIVTKYLMIGMVGFNILLFIGNEFLLKKYSKKTIGEDEIEIKQIIREENKETNTNDKELTKKYVT